MSVLVVKVAPTDEVGLSMDRRMVIFSCDSAKRIKTFSRIRRYVQNFLAQVGKHSAGPLISLCFKGNELQLVRCGSSFPEDLLLLFESVFRDDVLCFILAFPVVHLKHGLDLQVTR